MALLYIYYNNSVTELTVYSSTSLLKYTVDLKLLQVISSDGSKVLSIKRNENGLRRFLVLDFWSKYTGELILSKNDFKLSLELKSFWRGHWSLKLNDETLTIYRYYGYRTSLYSSYEKHCVVDFMDFDYWKKDGFVIKYQEEKYALALIAFMMVTYFIDGPEGRNLTPSYRWWLV